MINVITDKDNFFFKIKEEKIDFDDFYIAKITMPKIRKTLALDENSIIFYELSYKYQRFFYKNNICEVLPNYNLGILDMILIKLKEEK